MSGQENQRLSILEHTDCGSVDFFFIWGGGGHKNSLHIHLHPPLATQGITGPGL